MKLAKIAQHGARDRIVFRRPGEIRNQGQVAHGVFDFTGVAGADGCCCGRFGLAAGGGVLIRGAGPVGQGRPQFAVKIPVDRLCAVTEVEVDPLPGAVGDKTVGGEGGGREFDLPLEPWG